MAKVVNGNVISCHGEKRRIYISRYKMKESSERSEEKEGNKKDKTNRVTTKHDLRGNFRYYLQLYWSLEKYGHLESSH